ncbi:MAG: hypothetical protein KGI02_06755 [Thaumarchaeota archaeon]|nr:hypothetical protein [Nitrososphaerota archaeon]MDE1840390.1 hypothetical protein [Nitrososphaerota archaeon]
MSQRQDISRYSMNGNKCPRCNKLGLCVMDDEVCCNKCGIVLGPSCQLQETTLSSKLNLYQIAEVGCKKVNLEFARHIHENKSDVSRISNVCVKLDLPIYVAQDINIVYQKLSKHKQQEKKAYTDLMKQCEINDKDTSELKRNRPKGCTKAHIVAFAVHLSCRKYGLPRSDAQIIEAIKMNFGMKRTFTVLKTYSLNRVTAKSLGIVCDYDKSNYYMRILLGKMRSKIGDGPLFNKIQRQAIENLTYITDTRENTRAQRALDLALEGAKLNVQV